MGLDFNPTQPWVGVFAYAAQDTEYWGRHVVRPAHTFLARGGKNMTNRSAEDINVSEDARAALAGVAGSVGSYHWDPQRRRRDSKNRDSPQKQRNEERGQDREGRAADGEERAPEEMGNPLHHALRRQRDLLQVRKGKGWGLWRTLQSRSGSSLSALPGLSRERY